jgi:hypothetical protein
MWQSAAPPDASPTCWRGAVPTLRLVKVTPVIERERTERAEAKGGGRTSGPPATAPTLTLRPWNAVGGRQACEPPTLSGRCRCERHRDQQAVKASQGRASPATRGTCRPFRCPPKGTREQAGSQTDLPQSPAPPHAETTGRRVSLAPKETWCPIGSYRLPLPMHTHVASIGRTAALRRGRGMLAAPLASGGPAACMLTREHSPRAFRIPTTRVM